MLSHWVLGGRKFLAFENGGTTSFFLLKRVFFIIYTKNWLFKSSRKWGAERFFIDQNGGGNIFLN